MLVVLALAACGPAGSPADVERPQVAPAAAPLSAPLRDALIAGQPIVVGESDATSPVGAALRETVGALADLSGTADGLPEVVVDYPRSGSLFPPGFVPPTFLWHDDTPEVDAWLVVARFAEGRPLVAVVPGPPPRGGWIDPRAIDGSNELYQPTEYQASARSWTPPPAVWSEIQRRSVERPVAFTFAGIAAARAESVLSRGSVTITTSADDVGAPIFYRDVPLMPSVSPETGVIRPLAPEVTPLIEWRLRDVTLPESKVILTGMRTCANCHSFSRDGSAMGLDVDSRDGDKGGYAITPLERETVIDEAHVFTWNSFRDRPEERKTIGFLSRISPDGRHAMTTLNESIYAASFMDYRFLQVFFVTRGVLAHVSAETHEIRLLPGADDPEYVHCNPVWTPDGKTIVFARAKAFDASMDKETLARYPNDPREPQVLFDLYRIPFDEGRGGVAVPIQGASENGMSNTFPKVSPDGKWLVYTQCRNAQLMRPDGRLRIVPVDGGVSREMTCNTSLMNSWHSFSPSGRWMVFSSKSNTPYTQLFLTHIDDDGNDTPAILIPHCTADNRAANLPEFLNRDYDDFDDLSIRAVGHESYAALCMQGVTLLAKQQYGPAAKLFARCATLRPDFIPGQVNLGYALLRSGDREGARAAYADAVAIDPPNSRGNGALEMLLGIPPEPRASIRDLRAAAQRDSAPLAAWRALALELARADETDEALGLLYRLTELIPDDADVRLALAHLLLREDRAAEAVPQLLDAIRIRPTDVRSRVIVAWTLAAGADPGLRDAARAVEIAREACNRSHFGDARAVDAFAGALAAAGDMDYAIRNAEIAAELADRAAPDLAFWVRQRLALYRDGHRLGE